jgi:hypothetical protein
MYDWHFSNYDNIKKGKHASFAYVYEHATAILIFWLENKNPGADGTRTCNLWCQPPCMETTAWYRSTRHLYVMIFIFLNSENSDK